MSREGGNPAKEHYSRLRGWSCERLWTEEVAWFDQAAPDERIAGVAVVRAVGVVFSESATEGEKAAARRWLVRLLNDPAEKIRRYAMAALPKIGAGPEEEAALLALLRATTIDREKKFLGQTLDKIGGAATLKVIEETPDRFLPRTEQKVKASVARGQSPGAVRMDRTLHDFAGLRIHLRGRAGLESIVREEAEASLQTRDKFHVAETRRGLVALLPVAPFSLADLYTLRCFGTVGFVPAPATIASGADSVEALASVIASPLSRRVLETFTEGPMRYRLDFVGKGHQRSAVRRIADRAYALCPDVLNDAREAPWSIDIHSTGRGNSVELRPRLAPDPRFAYRRRDVPAASHPPLAACMARLAGSAEREIVWDPFCGSGLELIERSLLGGVDSVYGTDRSAAAIAIAEGNFVAAGVTGIRSKFTCCDFRDFAAVEGLGTGVATLVLTNPPMGRRVPIPNLRGLIADLFDVAAKVLRPGGRLVFANPFSIENPHPALDLRSRQVVDLGGFNCRLEKYVRLDNR
ncbi:MAG: hypothetical protein PHC88_15545 [Terrimicrobiaceae bacterium]|nr:hypothetical protein [Terrimicrobiaceae bacterium]